MATRIYLPSTGASAVNPAFGGWDESGSADRLRCVTDKLGSAMTSKVVAKATTATRALVRQYVSDPIAAQTIAAGTVKGQIRALESAANDNLDLVPLLIRVVSNDGSTYRSPAIIALGDYAAALEFGTALTNRKIADGDATAEVVAQDGDRIVIEIGIKNSGTGSSVSGTLSFGDDSVTDLAEDTTTTTANNPWIELSSTIVFGVGEWSDNLNAQQAPIKSLTRISQPNFGTGSGTFGRSSTDEAYGQKFTSTANGKLLRSRFVITKTGTPTDSLVCKLYDNNAGVPGTLLATSQPLLASMLIGGSIAPFEFAVPVTVSNGTVYHAIVWRTGALDTSNYYVVSGGGSNPYADGNSIRRTSGTWSAITSEDLRFDIEIEGANWYKFELDRGAAKLRAYRSTDGGTNWSEQDSSNAPAVSNLPNRFAVAAIRKGQLAYIAIPTGLTTLKRNVTFDMGANTWSAGSTVTFIGLPPENELSLNVAGVSPMFHNYREFSDDSTKNWILCQTVEVISSVSYRRVSDVRTGNGPITGSGNTIHYDLRSLVNDWADWTYGFYTKSDSTQIQLVTFNTAGSPTRTIVGGLSVTAVDQTTKYPLGLGCHFWRDGVNYVAVLYVDGSNTKVLYCEAGTAANTAGNWQVTTAIASASETDTSNPGFLVADNEQGGKLFLFRVNDTTGDLEYCHDSGSYNWTEPVVFESGFDIAGCAGTLSDRTVGMLLRDAATGNLNFRKLDVFF